MAKSRKSRSQSDMRRRRALRDSCDRVLIVCEGERTEPSYFEDLRDHYKLSTVNVQIKGFGKDPRALVQEAEDLQASEVKVGENYDQIYCVFDKDRHHHFHSASETANSAGFNLARTWPCFEYWLLLHFEFTRKPYQKTSKTPCENCIADLTKHLPEYEKSQPGLFGELVPRLETAKTNAEKALKDVASTGEPNPSTEVHQLVAYLQNLKVDGES